MRSLRSRLLDRGAEEMLIYPVELKIDSRGNTVPIPSETPVKIRVTVLSGRNADAELPGNVSTTILVCHTRSAPVSTWGRVEFRGELWDVAVPPTFTAGTSKATQSVKFTIRSRNKVNE